jgi:hypothetical protein
VQSIGGVSVLVSVVSTITADDVTATHLVSVNVVVVGGSIGGVVVGGGFRRRGVASSPSLSPSHPLTYIHWRTALVTQIFFFIFSVIIIFVVVSDTVV